jgi:hypothetical protein
MELVKVLKSRLNFQVVPPGASIALYKMASRSLEAKCVFWYQESDECMVTVKRTFHKQFWWGTTKEYVPLEVV